jgi:2-polyprenyl-3-methyl-5-hydroxy-6-metoxy-1,4-benzoquinol methylase
MIQDYACVICGSASGTEHTLQEKMFATLEEFTYWECCECGCLQIINAPQNLKDYYDNRYYSFSMGLSPLERYICKSYALVPRLSALIRRPSGPLQSVLVAEPKPKARILDVGCGSGRFVMVLRAMGFDAHGIDPFVALETRYIRRSSLTDVASGWDLIMFHHSLEHMTDHIGVLRLAREKLAVNGTCIVRIPIANWAWKHYRANWVQLDPPRHLIIHTPGSFQRAAVAAGLAIRLTTFDSNAFQFYGSEMCERNIPFSQEKAEIKRRGGRAMRLLNARAAELNRNGLGDSGCFFLMPMLQ